MNRTLPRLAIAVNSGSEIAVLRTIAMDGVGLALWDRRPSPVFQSWLDALPRNQLPALTVTAPALQVGSLLAEACDAAGMQGGSQRDRLVDDVSEIASVFSEVLAAPVLNVRLAASAGEICQKWKVDMARGWLLCTLRGPGTEYGPARPDGTPVRVHRIPTGAVALLRGFMWPGRELMGIVHRYPPARPGGEVRLVLVMDPAEDAGSC